MMKGFPRYLVTVLVLALACSLASAYDPSPLQDFCVSTNDSASGGMKSFEASYSTYKYIYAPFFLYNKLFVLHAVFVNGKFCKDPKLVSANDFFFSGLNIPRDTSNPLGSTVTLLNVDKILGLNTLGISLARIDFAPYGLNPPHIHPRGTEILVVLEGTLLVGFVTSNTDNRLFTKVLNAGDVFVFPIGLIHFQFNSGHTNAVAFAGLSSQNPGVITIANAVFGSNPPINPDVLAKAFQLDRNVINYLQKKF
ncbi:germin-like protein subfamily 1 member 11 [Alnus glutinosa]|uniref:germin-like protein subfamily 1 member 11 n=1 Tax=Alnus glutinosa TaxID=3517 RepID=UPI002D783AE7|nr:germin-like protein subfamily 1 member 11 [Alnus glutinosa]